MSKSARSLPAVLLLAASQIASQATAQSWPDRPIKFISSQAAGGGTDVLGRLVADQLSARLGQPIIYENRPGGGTLRARRLHVLLLDWRGAGDRSLYVQVAALRSDEGLHRSVRHRRSAVHGAGESGPAGEKPCRAVRLRQVQSGQARGRHRRRTALL